MRKVIAFGAFDVLHLGHVHFLERAKKLGNYLVVVIARDSVIRKVKNHDSVFNERERKHLVSSLKCVDKAILGDKRNTIIPILKERPQIIALGYDQPKDETELRRELAEKNFFPEKIVRIGPFKPERHKSSKLKICIERNF